LISILLFCKKGPLLFFFLCIGHHLIPNQRGQA